MPRVTGSSGAEHTSAAARVALQHGPERTRRVSAGDTFPVQPAALPSSTRENANVDPSRPLRSRLPLRHAAAAPARDRRGRPPPGRSSRRSPLARFPPPRVPRVARPPRPPAAVAPRRAQRPPRRDRTPENLEIDLVRLHVAHPELGAGQLRWLCERVLGFLPGRERSRREGRGSLTRRRPAPAR